MMSGKKKEKMYYGHYEFVSAHKMKLYTTN